MIEILVGLSLVVGLAMAGILNFSRVKRREGLQAVAFKMVELLEKARNKSLTGEGDTGWKVVVGQTSLSLQDTQDQVSENYNVTSGYELSGPVGEVIFQRVSGLVEECANECVFEVGETGGNLNYQIKVLSSGGVEY